jgi:hypothetical protein
MKVSKLIRIIFGNKINAIITSTVLTLAVLLVFSYQMSLLLFFTVIGILSLTHTLVTRNYIGFELCTLVTVLTSIHYGVATGSAIGVTSITLGLILSKNIDVGILVSIVGFIIIANISSFFSLQDVFFAGMISTIVYDTLLVSFYYFTGSDTFKLLSYLLTHVLINIAIFLWLAPVFIRVMPL